MFFRRLLQLTFVALIALIGVLAVLQTPAGFQHVLIPALAMSDLGELEAESGRLDLRGRLVLTKAHYLSHDTNLEATLESGSVAFDLLSIFGDQPLAFEHLKIDQGTLVIRNPPDAKEIKIAAIPIVPAAKALGERTPIRLPFTLQKGELTAFTYRQSSADGDIILEAEALALENLGPGQQATLDGKLAWRSASTDSSSVAVRVQLAVQLTLDEKSSPASWALQAEARRPPAPDLPGGTLMLKITADHESDDRLKAGLELSGNGPRQDLGHIRGNIELTGLSSAPLWRSLQIDTETKIDQLALGTVLSFLPPDPTRPELRGELNGSIFAKGRFSGPLEIKTAINLAGLRIEGSPVPARELEIGLSANSKLKKNGETVEIAELKIALGEGHLKASGSASPKDASFTLQITAQDFPLASVLALGGVDTAEKFGALPLSGELGLKRDGQANTTLTSESRLAIRLPQTTEPTVFHLSSDLTSRENGTLSAQIQATQPPRKGTLSIEAAIDKKTDLRIVIDEIDLTALLQPFIDAAPVDNKGPRPVQEIALPETLKNQRTEKPDPLELHVSIRESRYRDVHIGAMALDFSRSAEKTHVVLTGTEVSKGSLDLTYDSSVSGPIRSQWKGIGKGIRLQPLMDAFAGTTTVGGRLKFETSGFSKEPPPAPAINGLEGRLKLHLRDGKLEGFKALDMIAQATGLNLMGAFAFSSLTGEIQIEDGTATIQELEAGGVVTNLQAKGSVDLKGPGAFDIKINPRVGPSIAGLLKGLGPLHAVVGTAEGLLSLPINIVITGPLASPDYSVQSQGATEAVSSRGGKLVGTLLNQLTLGGASKLLNALLPSAKTEGSTEDNPEGNTHEAQTP